MKLSFALSSSKPSSKPSKPAINSHDDDRPSSAASKEFVTVFDPSKALPDPNSKNPIVIAPISNEWRPHKKLKNIPDLPVKSDDPNLQFEVDPNSGVEPTDSNISYGLNIRVKRDSDAKKDPDSEPKGEVAGSSSIDRLMLQKLRNDLDRLPEDRGMEEFEDVPVEDFARALLAGYGWREGRGIGKNAKEDVKVFEYKKRTGKEGIGFVNDVPLPLSKTDDAKENGVSNGNGVEGEKRGRYYVGKDVRIVGGSEAGLKGRIVEVIRAGESVVLRLSRSKEEVTVCVRDIADLGSVEEERCLKKLKELKIQEESKDASGGGRRSKDGRRETGRDEASYNKRRDSKRSQDRPESGGSRGSSSVSWLNSHIRVRIVSKEFKGGRLYLQKGEVVDVVGPTSCDISMDNSRELIQGVDQEFLETALPRRGGPVLVLYGRHKGVYGSLMEKDMENETAIVRDADTHALINVRLEQIAEYIGDPDDMGY